MAGEARLRRGDLATQDLAGETLVFLPEGDVCTINASAREVWELCNAERTAAEIAEAFADLHPREDREAMVSDALAAISQLRQAGLIEPADS